MGRLGRIDVANGYPISIRRVFREVVPASLVADNQFPAVCVFPPSFGQPQPEYHLRFQDHFVRITIVIHVRSPDLLQRVEMLALLESSTHEELELDPTRGGWAIDTRQVSGTDSDEGTPIAAGQPSTATIVKIYEVTFNPGPERPSHLTP